jgi:phosphatidylglycerol lysyltransferase
MKRRAIQYLGPLLVLAIFCAGAWLLYGHLRHYKLQDVLDDLKHISKVQLAAAMLITVVNYGILAVYDYLAFRFSEVPISLKRVAFASFVSYTFSYNFGSTMIGVPLRYRLYSAWGMSISKIVQMLVILALTFWFGVFTLAGLLFVCAPLRIPPAQLQEISTAMLNNHIPADAVAWFRYLFADSRPFGVVLLSWAGLYVGASALHRGSITIFRWKLPVPPFKLTIYQIAIASADMLVAGLVLYTLFPSVQGGYMTVLAVYLVAYVIVVLSHVPGGWGILEGIMMSLLTTLQLVPEAEMSKVIAGLVVFRVIYFLLPLMFSAVMLGWHELAIRRQWIGQLEPTASSESSDAPKTLNSECRPSPAVASDKPTANGRPATHVPKGQA